MRLRRRPNERFNLMKMLPNCLRQCSKHFSALSPSETGERKTHNPKNPAAKQGRTIHGPRTMYRALCEATARTCESPGRLRRSAPYKGLVSPVGSVVRWTCATGTHRPLAPLRGYPGSPVERVQTLRIRTLSTGIMSEPFGLTLWLHPSSVPCHRTPLSRLPPAPE
jgi:hypothetical protein